MLHKSQKWVRDFEVEITFRVITSPNDVITSKGLHNWKALIKPFHTRYYSIWLVQNKNLTFGRSTSTSCARQGHRAFEGHSWLKCLASKSASTCRQLEVSISFSSWVLAKLIFSCFPWPWPWTDFAQKSIVYYSGLGMSMVESLSQLSQDSRR